MQGENQIITKNGAVACINEYYPFGLQNQQTSSTQFGSKEQRYKFGSKELMKDFNLEQEDYGARLYNPQIARWSVVDPMADQFLLLSPYNYATNNPALFIDPDGKFTFSVSEEYLRTHNIEDMEAFNKMLKNMADNLEKFGNNNPSLLKAFSKITGQSFEQIQKDFKSGSGPNIVLGEIAYTESQDVAKNEIKMDINPFLELASMGGTTNSSDLKVQTFGVMLYSMHEYGHLGDKRTNGGRNSGQGNVAGGDLAKSSRTDGSQISESFSGHRGTDIEQVILFGNIIKKNNPSKENYNRQHALFNMNDGKVSPGMRDNIKKSKVFNDFNNK